MVRQVGVMEASPIRSYGFAAGAKRSVSAWLWRSISVLCLAGMAAVAQAELPEGWNFLEYNEALSTAKRLNKPVFVYYGFKKCPYCVYVNRHTFVSDELRKTYSDHYVLAYFDIRGNPDDMMDLADGTRMRRADAIKHLKGSPVPAWAFLDSKGSELLARRGSRTKVAAFNQFDAFIAGGAYKKQSFEAFLASRGWVEEKVE
jgi:thioredoxin-related protein